MDATKKSHLPSLKIKNDVQYFITFLADRFFPLNERFARQFERRFGGTFKPIYVLSAEPNDLFKPEYYMMVNKLFKSGEVCLQDYEDQNEEFSSSRIAQKFLASLQKKQGTVFLVPFTASHLTVTIPGVRVIAPRSDLATKFDNKIFHTQLFKKLGVPTHTFAVFKNAADLKKHADHLPACYLSASFTSGGAEAGFVRNRVELDHFLAALRSVNQSAPLLATRIIEHIPLAPNVNAIVLGKNQVEIVAIADQILHGNAYMGNMYPSIATSAQQRKIIVATKKVGNYLSRQGYRGLFGIDYLIDDKGNMYATDLNPRRQGGYLCNVLMSKNIDLIDLEIRIALGEKLPAVKMKDFQPDFAWGHSKIKPHGHLGRIKKVFKQGEAMDPFQRVGAEFAALFYSKGDVITSGNIGYYIVSGRSRKKVQQLVESVPEKMLKKVVQE